MIRLSEALARVHLDEVVRPAYVHEAARLLRKSIIHIESEDVHLETEAFPGPLVSAPAAEIAAAAEEEEGQKEPEGAKMDVDEQPGDKGEKKKKKKKEALTLTYEEYQRITTILVRFNLFPTSFVLFGPLASLSPSSSSFSASIHDSLGPSLAASSNGQRGPPRVDSA